VSTARGRDFRLIDYQARIAPQRARALQLPIYSLCAEQRLKAISTDMTIGEGVPGIQGAGGGARCSTATDREKVLQWARTRLVDAVDAIAPASFSRPHDVYLCETLVLCRSVPDGLRGRCLSPGFR